MQSKMIQPLPTRSLTESASPRAWPPSSPHPSSAASAHTVGVYRRTTCRLCSPICGQLGGRRGWNSHQIHVERRQRLSCRDGRRREDGCKARRGCSRRLQSRRWRREGTSRRCAPSNPWICVFGSHLLPDGLSLSSWLPSADENDCHKTGRDKNA